MFQRFEQEGINPACGESTNSSTENAIIYVLRPQHLNGLQLIRDMCKGTLTGGAVQSTEISLEPGTLRSGQFTCDTRTAGYTVFYMWLN